MTPLTSHALATATTTTDGGPYVNIAYLMLLGNDNQNKLPTWYSVVRDIFLIQLSSAFVERVLFSILRMLGRTAGESVEQPNRSGCMIKYNRDRKDEKNASGSVVGSGYRVVGCVGCGVVQLALCNVAGR